jgi:ABC-2 type transport system permease protein
MASLGTLITLEFSKLIRRPMTWILALIFVSFMAFMYFALTLAILAADVEGMEGFDPAGLQDQMFLPDGLAFGNSLLVGVSAVLMIILAAGSFGSEFSWATVRTTLLMRADRTTLVWSKLTVLAVMALLLSAVGMVIVVAGALVSELIAGEAGVAVGDRLTGDLLADAAVVTGRTVIYLAVWALIGGMLALATSSMAIGTGVGLATYFVGDLFTSLIGQLGDIGELAARMMPNYGVNQLIMMNQVSPPEFTGTDYAWIVGNLLLYVALFTVLGLYRFRRMNVLAASS